MQAEIKLHNQIDLLRSFFINEINLSQDAANWLCSLFRVINFVDDIKDGGSISDDDFNDAAFDIFFAMPHNRFFLENNIFLAPIMINSLNKWHASNKIEEMGDSDEFSHSWRASYYDVVLLVMSLCNGAEYARKNGWKVNKIYAEKFNDYIEEMKNA